MLLNEDSDAYCTFHTADRDQFLFRLFEHMCLGGQICQHEDNIDCYLDFTKQMYKDLIRYKLYSILLLTAVSYFSIPDIFCLVMYCSLFTLVYFCGLNVS